MLRGILAPVGHGLWTAILGGALFAVAQRRGRLRLTGAVLAWYVMVAALHFLWDASSGLAVWLTMLLTGTASQCRIPGGLSIRLQPVRRRGERIKREAPRWPSSFSPTVPGPPPT